MLIPNSIGKRPKEQNEVRGNIVRMENPKVVSLFSGCGGLDLGLIKAGYRIVWANDCMPDAVETYKNNIGRHIILGDIKEIGAESIPDCDMVMGGPPCQAFSLVGKRDPKDKNANLIWNFYDVVRLKSPKIFLMENVTGLKAAKDERGNQVFQRLLESFQELNYSVNSFILNSANYGVPQLRRRLFIIGSLDGKTITPPEETHSKEPEQKSLFKARKMGVMQRCFGRPLHTQKRYRRRPVC